MAYDDTEDQAPPHPADPPQPLADFVGSFTDPTAQGVFRDAAVKVQDYLVRRRIADENTAAADRLFANLGRFRDGMVGMVQGDPAATHLGLSIVPDIVNGIVGSHPYLADEQREPTATELTTGMQQEIARAGVMAYADRDETAARRLLDQPHVASLFDESGHRDLNGYIGAMATARSSDAAALAQQRAVDDAQTREHSTLQYFSTLVDPATQEMQFPPDWAQRVTADPSLPPAYTANMLNLYGRLQRDGDAPATDPFIAASLIGAAANGQASVPAVMQFAGNDLRLNDALTIAAMTRPQGETSASLLNDLVQQGRSALAAPENGPAGSVAFGRYMNWLLPAVRSGAVSLNPAEDNYAGLRLPQFAPSGNDLLEASVHGRVDGRPSLDEIFGGRRGRSELRHTKQ